MKRFVVLAISLAALLPMGCVNHTATSSEETINDEPEVLQIHHLSIHYVNSQIHTPWHFEAGKRQNGIKLADGGPKLVIQFWVKNSSKTKRFNFTGWCFGANTPTSSDDLGNEIKAVNFDGMTGSIWAGDIIPINRKFELYPDNCIWMAVVFELPTSKAKTIRIELPAEAFGLTGKFVLKQDLQKSFKVPSLPQMPSTGDNPRTNSNR